jgi:hypothetical protein
VKYSQLLRENRKIGQIGHLRQSRQIMQSATTVIPFEPETR